MSSDVTRNPRSMKEIERRLPRWAQIQKVPRPSRPGSTEIPLVRWKRAWFPAFLVRDEVQPQSRQCARCLHFLLLRLRSGAFPRRVPTGRDTKLVQKAHLLNPPRPSPCQALVCVLGRSFRSLVWFGLFAACGRVARGYFTGSLPASTLPRSSAPSSMDILSDFNSPCTRAVSRSVSAPRP